ncbi:MAG: VOC family protein [Planktomarina sp.]|jgi:catechol 2,3-dioxygenase-like lactoylglutathione lyase family enzyme|nr:VOC family protein [Planktomarina sp.]
MINKNPPMITSLDHLVLTVSDMATSVAFYRDILGMQALEFEAADGSRRRALAFGAQKINLHPAQTPFTPHAAQPRAGSADLCFLSSTPLDAWLPYLKASGQTVLEGPVQRNGALGPIVSLYIRDPDGNLLEIANRL